MKKILVLSLIYCLLLVACASKKVVNRDYEGQRERATEGFKELDKE